MLSTGSSPASNIIAGKTAYSPVLPALIHNCASSRMPLKTWSAVLEPLVNMQLFLSYSAFHGPCPLFPSSLNRCPKSLVWYQFMGRKAGIEIHEPTLSQMHREETHSCMRWYIVSRFLMHRGQKYWFGHCLTWRRAAVHTPFGASARWRIDI